MTKTKKVKADAKKIAVKASVAPAVKKIDWGKVCKIEILILIVLNIIIWSNYFLNK